MSPGGSDVAPRRAFPIGACATWLVSAAPFALPDASLDGLSRAALAALPWLAYVGLPRVAAARAPATWLALGLAAPLVATGAWIDRAHGASERALVVTGGAALGLGALLALAAHASAREARARLVHTVGWFLLVALPPLVAGALVLGGASAFGPAPGWLAAWNAASALAWNVGALALERAAEVPVAALVAAAALWLATLASARRASRAAVMLALVSVAWGAASSGARAQNRAVFADVELHGPLAGVVLDAGPAGSTRVEGVLGPGESRHVSVPVPLADDALRVEPRVRIEGAAGDLEGVGRARFLGWRGGASPLAELGPALRARPRPAVAAPTVHVSRAVPLVLLAVALVTLAARGRAWLAGAAALAGVLATWPLVRVDRGEADARVVVYDGDVEGAAWRRVDAACDELVLPPEVTEFELATDPARARVTWHVTLDERGTWRARAPGARLYLASVVVPGEGAVARTGNAFARLDATWVRHEGSWTPHGGWPIGGALGPALALPAGPDAARSPAAAPVPPGWLATGLPQGVGVLLGHLAPDEALPDLSGTATGAWLRVTGF